MPTLGGSHLNIGIVIAPCWWRSPSPMLMRRTIRALRGAGDGRERRAALAPATKPIAW